MSTLINALSDDISTGSSRLVSEVRAHHRSLLLPPPAGCCCGG
ncbi:hypothetical protein [Corynebacterium auris]|nr:hypothetical protein [Corynebacterium auris]